MSRGVDVIQGIASWIFFDLKDLVQSSDQVVAVV